MIDLCESKSSKPNNIYILPACLKQTLAAESEHKYPKEKTLVMKIEQIIRVWYNAVSALQTQRIADSPNWGKKRHQKGICKLSQKKVSCASRRESPKTGSSSRTPKSRKVNTRRDAKCQEAKMCLAQNIPHRTISRSGKWVLDEFAKYNNTLWGRFPVGPQNALEACGSRRIRRRARRHAR
ncbi:uncharacterized protein KNAG_0D00640 [Huiozyma naganishii CBS 8797]|uniref:Uncharacterized protein n=1 Tax=Huiozyma naganishii (strain ATCC MYA-139 / BCRC 22969 / CBS 8797 / KCTC 17520 / NBRC 10181 / NCYC 3082 / Yp74L-3) TaxID=1071383 RepID=J7S6K1_HUIN7|nr:hypothetical protein KNAG_0D00640 [Kazachstania naganishii CBS 8797]CCK69816.1 hypothetical protein KNAG_0D00640 [Kazachstania naganishii CBS 8797]